MISCRLSKAIHLFLIAVAFASGTPVAAEGDAEMKPPAWLDELQTYNILPMLPERAKELHITVNGPWGGGSGKYPVLPDVPQILDIYDGNPEQFIVDGKAAGLVTCGVINGLEGYASLQQTLPNIRDMACRKANGEVAAVENGMLLMCTNNPDWRAWQLDTGKEVIDLGVDLVNLDTPMSASFLSGFLGAGLCNYCLDNFESWLEERYSAAELESRFGLSVFEREQVINTLSPFQQQTPMADSVFIKDTPEARLFQDFITCQEEASFRSCAQLLQALRQHAAARGRNVAFCTNTADLGTANPGGHWVRALMFADLVDLFTYEQNTDPEGRTFVPMTELPRGKWAMFHKLAHAINGRRNPTLIHAHDNTDLKAAIEEEGKAFTAMTRAWTAESYAADGAYMPFFGDKGLGAQAALDKIWQGAYDHFRFVLDNKDLYDGELRSGSPLVFLFLYNERGRTIPAVFPSYLGFSQGFIEGNFPFDVVFGGDKKYVKDRMTIDSLKGYKVALIPSPIDPTDNQKSVLQQFAREGGTVICQEPELLGLSGERVALEDGGCIASEFAFGDGRVLVIAGEVAPTGTNDTGANFFQQYKAEDRAQIIALAEKLGLASVLPEQQDGLVCAYPILQPEQKRAVIHLVNYDVDAKDDAIKQKENIRVRLPRPDFLSGEPMLSLSAPGMESPQAIPVVASGDMLECVVPNLGIYATLTITGQS